MAKQLSDEDVERIAAKVAEKVHRGTVVVLPPSIYLDPRWPQPPYYQPYYQPLQVWC